MSRTDEFQKTSKSGKGVSIALWATQVLLAALFLFAGATKFLMPMEELTKGSSLPGWFLLFIGAMEILGGIGLIVPALTRLRPALTPVAACGLVVIMIGATVVSMPMGAVALIPLAVGILAAFVAYGRFRLKPIPVRS
jgi:hypothetical protein